MSNSSSPRSSEARERARQIAAKQSKRSTASSRRWLQISVVAVLVVIIGIVAIVYTQTREEEIPEAGPVPASSNQYGGIVLTQDGIEQNTSGEQERDVNDITTSTASATPAEGASGSDITIPPGLPTPEEAAQNGEPVHVTMFQDYNCVHCAGFEEQYGEQLKEQVMNGDIELEIRNLNFLDGHTTTQYSSRAAAAAYSVAEQVDSEAFLDWQLEMYSHEGEGGLSDSEIEEIASRHGADISADLDSNKYRPMVNVTVAEAQENGITGTPTVFVDSQSLQQEDFMSFLDEVKEAKAGN
ncbi:DsbA family protein [Rothia sp. AR01]|uniref:DsbA family protein n=1 Tax=Rothia santali TaxID=2949643 RepID=A0A9X2KIR0_9MICC|nr:thioredoxin domain-containing protein [Rothia santali]MCP3426295.1 DsbA family protein [Rothia santali]